MHAHQIEWQGGLTGMFQSTKGSNLSTVRDITSPIFHIQQLLMLTGGFYVSVMRILYVRAKPLPTCAPFVHSLKVFSSSEPTSLLFFLPLLRDLASGRKFVTARSSWTILRNVSQHTHTHMYEHTHTKSRGYVSQGQEWRSEGGWKKVRKEGKEEDRGTTERKGKERRRKTSGCTLALGGQREQMSLTVQKWIFLPLLQLQPNTSNPPYSPQTAARQRQIKY